MGGTTKLIGNVPSPGDCCGIAFVVEDLEAAIAGKEVLIPPNSPTEGVRVAFIVDQGAPIEFLQFDRPESEIWPHNAKFRIT